MSGLHGEIMECTLKKIKRDGCYGSKEICEERIHIRDNAIDVNSAAPLEGNISLHD